MSNSTYSPYPKNNLKFNVFMFNHHAHVLTAQLVKRKQSQSFFGIMGWVSRLVRMAPNCLRTSLQLSISHEGKHSGCLLKAQFITGPKHWGVLYLSKGTLIVNTLKVPWHPPPDPPLLLRPVPYRQEVKASIHFTSNSSSE